MLLTRGALPVRQRVEGSRSEHTLLKSTHGSRSPAIWRALSSIAAIRSLTISKRLMVPARVEPTRCKCSR